MIGITAKRARIILFLSWTLTIIFLVSVPALGLILLLVSIALQLLTRKARIEEKKSRKPTAGNVGADLPSVSVAPHLPTMRSFIEAESSGGEEIKGLWQRRDIARRILLSHSASSDYLRARLDAVLVREPLNPHDPNAIAVFIDSMHVGYLSKERAAWWSKSLDNIEQRGYHLVVTATLSSSGIHSNSLNGHIRLPDPAWVFPSNDYPQQGETVLLDRGAKVQVTQEHDHMDVLTPFLPAEATPLALTAHIIKDIRARSAANAVEIQLNGERVGIMSAAQTAKYWELVKYFQERRVTPVMRGVLTGNSIKADIVLHIPKPETISESWLDTYRNREVVPVFFEEEPTTVTQRPEFMWDDDNL